MDKKKIVKIEVKKNYIIESYKKPKNVIKYVRKEIIDKNGFHNLATLARSGWWNKNSYHQFLETIK